MAFTSAQKHLFYTEIAKLLAAGFGIRDAGRAMLDTRLPAQQADLLRQMDADLEAGKTISSSFGEGTITELERSIIGAGERGGRMAQAFQHLADYYGMLATARRDALQSLGYPMALLHMGLFVGILAPALMGGQKDSGEIFRDFIVALLLFYGLCFLVWLGIRALLRAAPGSAPLDRTLNAIPVLGSARRAMAMARFTKVYHTCLLAGLSMNETVQTATDASHSGVIRETGRQMIETLKQGGALGPQFVSSGAFPSAFARSYATAEESGSLDKDLDRWSKVYQEDAARGVKTLSNVISKGVYFLVLLFVAWTILSIYSGYYDVIQSYGE